VAIEGPQAEPEGSRAAPTAQPTVAAGSASARVPELQRTLGNAAVARLLRQPAPAAVTPRLPSVSSAAAVPARIKGMQAEFHARMSEADEIVKGTKFHYDYVNGIYAGNFQNAQVVIGQAGEEQLRNEQIREAFVAGVSFALSFSPHGAAANVLIKIIQIAHKVDEARERVEKAAKVVEAIHGAEKKEPAEGGPAQPSELQILGLEHVIELMSSIAEVSNAGNVVLDGAVDLSTDIGSNAPSSGALDAKDAEALNAAEAACSELLASTDPLLADLRQLRNRRKVTIPSWREVEQDIWLQYFASKGRIGTEEVLRNHMVDIGLWGPQGQPGGRLGVAETVEGVMSYQDPKTVPAHEDEEKQQSVPATQVEWMQLIRNEAAALPAKWQRIMLLID
jgi:hypothetical protein